MIKHWIFLVSFCLTIATNSAISLADDWPQWLGGPSRLNRIESPNSPDSTIDYELVWKTNLGLGYSSILITEQRLIAAYVNNNFEKVALLDARTGKKLWSRPIGPASSNGPCATPAVGDGRIFAVGGEGELHALSLADGSPIWHRDLTKDFGTKKGVVAASPLLVRDRLIVLAGGVNGKSVVALNIKDGKVLWTSQSDLFDSSSPALAVLDGVEQVIAIAQNRVFSVRLSDGKLLWSLPSKVDPWATALPLENNRVFLPMRNEHMVIECKREGESWKVRKVWVNQDLIGSGSSFAGHQGLLFGSTKSGVVCLDESNGDLKWKQEVEEGSLTLIGDRIAFVGRDSGKVSFFSASATETKYWPPLKPKVGGQGWTPVTASGTDLYIRSDSVFARYRQSKGRTAKGNPPPADGAKSHGKSIRGYAGLMKPGLLTIFGELHGTTEAPAFVGKMVERAVESNKKVRLGLEIPINLQPNADAFLSSSGDEKAVQQLIQGEFWSYGDGRSSQAMVALFDKIRRLKQSNHDVDIFLYDMAKGNIHNRDKIMADNILSAVQRSPESVYFVLTGNLHARINSQRYMGWHIMKSHRQTISLDISHSDGSAWLSTNEGRGPMQLRGVDRGEKPFIERRADWDGEAYHGFYYVGKISASTPAMDRLNSGN